MAAVDSGGGGTVWAEVLSDLVIWLDVQPLCPRQERPRTDSENMWRRTGIALLGVYSYTITLRQDKLFPYLHRRKKKERP